MCLPNLFAIYVPSTIDVDKPIDNDHYVRRVAKLLALRFGGASWESINGAWYSDSLNDLVIEPVTRVYAYSATNTAQDKAYVKVIAHALQTWLTQESVAYECISYSTESGLNFT